MLGNSKQNTSGDYSDQENITVVADSLRSIIQSLRLADRQSEKALGISSAQLRVLHALQDRPSQSINQVAERTLTHQSSVSMVVAKLVEARLVTRSASRGDGRSLSLSLSPAGRTFLRRSPKGAHARLVAALGSMPPGELDALANALLGLKSVLAADALEGQRKNRVQLRS